MLKQTRSIFVACAAIFLFGGVRAEALTIEQATDPRGITSAALSPDGRHVAAIGFTGHQHGLILIDTVTGKSRLIVHSSKVERGYWRMNRQPRTASWVTNDLIAVDFGFESESVDLEGGKVAAIGTTVIGKAHPGKTDSPTLLVYANEDGRGFASVNARTGKLEKFSLPVGGELLAWAFDSKGELRAATLRDSAFWSSKTSVSNWYKPPGNASWEKLAEFKVTDNYWIPVDVPDQEGKLTVMSSEGRDTRAVFSYDVKSREIGELMVGHPTQDILRVSGGLAGPDLAKVVTEGMKPVQVWFDERWAAVQQSIDASLPGHINLLSGNPRKLVLVYSYSDVEPGSWFLVDTENTSMKLLVVRKLGVDGIKMRPMEIVEYAARDGVRIPAYLTRPEGKPGPQPMVVLIHGGPTVRDWWGWDEEVQLLAARGYVVFQPQFRGSSGFGRKFLESGFGQWGLSMQDDVTDGVQQLISNGIADPARICIYGASYGGYAALWGLAKTPDLYRCGVSFAGVSDIEHMFNDNSDRNDSKIAKEVLRFRVGDLRYSQAQFDAVSPLKQAHRISAPILLMHGTEDERVPISHSKRMMRALDDAGKKYEWEVFENEGHGLYYINSRRKFYERLFTFLDKYIGTGQGPAATAANAK